MEKEIERQVAVVIRVDDKWHRAFELVELGSRHIMLWENCPLHDGPGNLIPEIITPELPDGTQPERLCPICFEDEIKALD